MKLSKDYLSGLDLMEKGEWEKAIKKFTMALEASPNDVECFSKRGVCYLNLNKHDLSMFDFNKALELEPNYSYRYACRAFLKTRMRDMDGAIKDYEKALELDPDDPILYNNMGLVVEQMGNIKKAQKYFQRSNELEGYDPEKRFGKGLTEKAEESEGKELIDQKKSEPIIPEEKEELTKGEIAKKVFTDKNTFKEFLKFIGNGFKAKK
ncbi:MAG: tetratricopeptide repeat protein [Crocinitomicaceae bacterium]|nr:tetratricopeptide repeat protein [Crocinitomicaceae bacterium]